VCVYLRRIGPIRLFAQTLIAINECTTLRNGNLIGSDICDKIFYKTLIAINLGHETSSCK